MDPLISHIHGINNCEGPWTIQYQLYICIYIYIYIFMYMCVCEIKARVYQ